MFRYALPLLFSLLATPAHADEAVKRQVEATFGGKVDSVSKTPHLGLYEIRTGDEILYTDEKVRYIIAGQLIEARSGRNLTQERLDELAKINFADLPLQNAIKQVRGNGKRVFATFEDPNCSYCKRLARDLQTLDNVTIYTFLYPIFGAESMARSKAVWCSRDRARAWNDMMIKDIAPNAATNCANPIDRNVEIGRKLGIRGTPTIYLASGKRIVGAVSVQQLEQELTALGK